MMLPVIFTAVHADKFRAVLIHGALRQQNQHFISRAEGVFHEGKQIMQFLPDLFRFLSVRSDFFVIPRFQKPNRRMGIGNILQAEFPLAVLQKTDNLPLLSFFSFGQRACLL